MKQTSTPTDDRPAFELASYDAPAPLPSDKRLTHESELKGHTITALITDPSGRLGSQATVVIVTETRCWLVLEAESGDRDEDPSINVSGGNSYPPALTLSDYLSARDMFTAGLILQGEFDALWALELEKERLRKANRANQLRRELATLEAETK